MSAHPFDTELALHATGDLSGWERFRTGMHVRSCMECRARIEAFRLDRKRLTDAAADTDMGLPPGVNWDRLAAEMTANIHVGLAAGECISPVAARPSRSAWSSLNAWNWKPIAAAAGFVMVFSAAWWLNLASDTTRLARVWDRITSSGVSVMPGEPAIEHGPVVAATWEGIEFRENGSRMGVSSGATQPVSVSVSFGGYASAQYVDDDTGQVTIATVYVP